MSARVLIAALLLAARAARADEPVPIEPVPIEPVPIEPVSVEPLAVEPLAVERARSDSSFLFRLAVSPIYTHAIERGFWAARVQAEFGADLREPAAISGRFSIDLGASQGGLGYQRLLWGLFFAGRLGPRVRLGPGVHVGAFIVDRASKNADPMVAFTVGGDLELAVALMGGGTHAERAATTHGGALDLVLAGSGDWVDVNGNPGASAAASVSLGLAYRH